MKFFYINLRVINKQGRLIAHYTEVKEAKNKAEVLKHITKLIRDLGSNVGKVGLTLKPVFITDKEAA